MTNFKISQLSLMKGFQIKWKFTCFLNSNLFTDAVSKSSYMPFLIFSNMLFLHC